MSTGWSNFSVGNGSQVGDDDIPACVSCKKRKLRCSREFPTCAHCRRLTADCVYHPKQKPGLKPGAVDALTRRVAFLERILLDDAGNIKPKYNEVAGPDGGFSANNSDLAGEFADSPGQQQHNADNSFCYGPADESTEGHADAPQQEAHVLNPLKRKLAHSHTGNWLLDLEDNDISEYLPHRTVLSKLADFFCTSFHHWIPFVHKQRLLTRVREGVRDVGSDLILHALVAIGLRHLDANVLFLDQDQIQQQIQVSRLIVETKSVRDISVYSLQALIFIVFDHLNNGQAHRAWPLIGLLTRTIDYLQLTIEPSALHSGSLMKPVRLVQSSNDWTELEERRRLFWVIFLLDRFCSISTGWNTSLTAEDVHRRLPADGGYFTREEPVTTPYFGLWNKAAAKIGKSLANVPAQYNEEDPSVESSLGASPGSANGCIDASKLGAFAYCVEATESLSQVTTFFLQQRINWQDKEHAINWLTRFKELDLRLVHWKIFLPPKWKDSDISADRTIVDMDPNLTLAHITHNTSMILLHHPVAFPPEGWNDYVALPRECSAQTCELAAVETSNIVDKFLAHTAIPFVNTQFAFSAFVAAKALLFDHHATRKSLRPEFKRLVRHLWNMSDKWTGSDPAAKSSKADTSQAGIYAHHLECLHDACQQDLKFTFDLYDHSCQSLGTQRYSSSTPLVNLKRHPRNVSQMKSPLSHHVRHNSFNNSQSALDPPYVRSTTMAYGPIMDSPVGQSPYHTLAQSATSVLPRISSPSYATPPTTNGFNDHSHPQHNTSLSSIATLNTTVSRSQPIHRYSSQSVQDESLLTLSDTFMDSQFLDLDRVITFEDANFFIPWQ